MRLLIDQNLSWRLKTLLAGVFEEIAHVEEFGMDETPDDEIAIFAARGGWLLLTKDHDFVGIALTNGPPMKVIHLGIGNGPVTEARDAILRHRERIQAFADDSERSILLVSA